MGNSLLLFFHFINFSAVEYPVISIHQKERDPVILQKTFGFFRDQNMMILCVLVTSKEYELNAIKF